MKDENVEEGGNKENKDSNDECLGREIFISESVINQRTINNLVRKYNNCNIYYYRAPEKKEYMFVPKLSEIVMFITH